MIAVAHEFTFEPQRQVEIANKRLARIERAVTRFTIALRPARVLARVAAMLASVRFARITGTTAEFSRVVVIAIARANVEQPDVVAVETVVPAALCLRAD